MTFSQLLQQFLENHPQPPPTTNEILALQTFTLYLDQKLTITPPIDLSYLHHQGHKRQHNYPSPKD